MPAGTKAPPTRQALTRARDRVRAALVLSLAAHAPTTDQLAIAAGMLDAVRDLDNDGFQKVAMSKARAALEGWRKWKKKRPRLAFKILRRRKLA